MSDKVTKKQKNSLLKWFRIGTKKTKDRRPEPFPQKATNKDGNYIPSFELNLTQARLNPIKTDSQYDKSFNRWLYQTTETSQSLAYRFDRYDDLDFMRKNSPIINKAITQYGIETVQADSQDSFLSVDTKKKDFANFIYELFDNCEINEEKIKNIAEDLAQYGDGLAITPLGKKGYEDFIVENPRELLDRFEFKANKHQYDSEGSQNVSSRVASLYKNNNRYNAIMSILANDQTVDSSFYKSYLFGYNISGRPIAPWEVLHFRMDAYNSEFYPYGRSRFINAIAPFKELKSSEILSNMLKQAKFPREIFEVSTGKRSPQEQFAVVSEVSSMWHNQNAIRGDKEEQPLGSEYWMPDGLVKYNSQEPRIDVNNVYDLEYFENKMIQTVNIPGSYLKPNEARDFGTSGISLIQQYKPFARDVYTIQTVILKELTRFVKIHCLINNKYIDEPFTLSMNFPATEDSKDRMSVKSDNLRLVKDIITGFGESLGLDRGESLPIDIVKDVFLNYSFIDKEDIDEWIKIYQKSKEPIEEKRIREKINKRFYAFKESERNVIYEKYNNWLKESRKFEGVTNNRHYYSSMKADKYFNQFREYYNTDMKGKYSKLKEIKESVTN